MGKCGVQNGAPPVSLFIVTDAQRHGACSISYLGLAYTPFLTDTIGKGTNAGYRSRYISEQAFSVQCAQLAANRTQRAESRKRAAKLSYSLSIVAG